MGTPAGIFPQFPWESKCWLILLCPHWQRLVVTSMALDGFAGHFANHLASFLPWLPGGPKLERQRPHSHRLLTTSTAFGGLSGHRAHHFAFLLLQMAGSWPSIFKPRLGWLRPQEQRLLTTSTDEVATGRVGHFEHQRASFMVSPGKPNVGRRAPQTHLLLPRSTAWGSLVGHVEHH